MPEITPGVLRNNWFEVAEYVDGVEPTVWTRVNGMQELTPPKNEKNLEDDSSYDSDGYGSQIATGIAWMSDCTIKIPRAGLTVDPGQEILRRAGKGLLEEGFVHARFRNELTPTEGESGIADVQYELNGGPHTDLTTAKVTLTGRGKLEEVTIPA